MPLADGRTQRVARDPDRQRRQRVDARARRPSLFGRAVRQTLEPRLFYVNTPYRRQDDLPNFDSGAEGLQLRFDLHRERVLGRRPRLRLEPADRRRDLARARSRDAAPRRCAWASRSATAFSDQRVTPDDVPLTQRFSDVLVFGSTSLVPRWNFDTAVQYNPDSHRIERSLAGLRYSPGPYRTVGADLPAHARPLGAGRARLAVAGLRARARGERGERAAGGNGCGGTLYSVGRVNYSTRDSRLTDSIVGLEYDAGCWIGRVVVERLSTGRSEATTRLLLAAGTRRPVAASAPIRSGS